MCREWRLVSNEVLRIAFPKQWQSIWFSVDEGFIGIYQFRKCL